MTYFKNTDGTKEITTKNNTNNVSKGDFLKLINEDGAYMQGTVEYVSHVVSIWQNAQGLERSTHDIVIVINETYSKSLC